jgi:hypothetical protein
MSGMPSSTAVALEALRHPQRGPPAQHYTGPAAATAADDDDGNDNTDTGSDAYASSDEDKAHPGARADPSPLRRVLYAFRGEDGTAVAEGESVYVVAAPTEMGWDHVLTAQGRLGFVPHAYLQASGAAGAGALLPLPRRVLLPRGPAAGLEVVATPGGLATVIRVAPRSPAARAGVAVGDTVLTADGAPALGPADVLVRKEGIPYPVEGTTKHTHISCLAGPRRARPVAVGCGHVAVVE